MTFQSLVLESVHNRNGLGNGWEKNWLYQRLKSKVLDIRIGQQSLVLKPSTSAMGLETEGVSL